ncbi:MAG: T9SS type A sorting domain-containing protein [Candidatus Cloacimonetes bacterium]|nr:T9SS type A sorting domain-containing protein [Candidatus Cloacimonadota bacterium]
MWYSYHDIVLKNMGQRYNYDDDGDGSIDEDPLGSPFNINDPSWLYCFTLPFDEDEDGLIDEDCDYPGFESSISYFYDYSPFGTEGQRDWGNSSSSNNHIEMEIAVTQEVYTWPVQYYADMIIIKNTVYNYSTIDTLFDVCYAYLMDCDIGPQCWSPDDRSLDDISSYVPGEGYEFGYSYDEDGDNGLSPGLLGFKVFNPTDYNMDCWLWQLGDGPDDHDPFDVTAMPTANEKYWLMTGRNPDDSKYTSLREYPSAQIGDPFDTRFLYSIYGNQLGSISPTENSININPGESLELYSIIIMDTDVEGLQDKFIMALELIDSGFDYSLFDGLPSIPYLVEVQDAFFIAGAKVRWNVLSAPDEFMVYYKEADAPAYTWEFIVVDHALSEYTITDLQPETEYKFKVACIYDEVYLESRTLTVLITEENQSIWPGDTDNNGYVNEDDIIPIGVYWRDEGNARDQVSFNWAENDYPTGWDEPYAPFADCNGDGKVNITDVLGICLNWNYSRSTVMSFPAINWIDLEEYRESFIEIYNSLGSSGVELLLKNRIAQQFDLPIIEIVGNSRLSQNYPNPFNPSTIISYSTTDEGNVELNVYNIKGQLVKKLVNEHQLTGNYTVIWDGTDLNERKVSSGLYFYRLKVNDKMIDTKKMILLR